MLLTCSVGLIISHWFWCFQCGWVGYLVKPCNYLSILSAFIVNIKDFVIPESPHHVLFWKLTVCASLYRCLSSCLARPVLCMLMRLLSTSIKNRLFSAASGMLLKHTASQPEHCLERSQSVPGWYHIHVRFCQFSATLNHHSMCWKWTFLQTVDVFKTLHSLCCNFMFL